MSELTICNFCSLQVYRRAAKKKNDSVKVVPCATGFNGGFDLFAVPAKQKLRGVQHTRKGTCYAAGARWMGWMMAITDSCVC